MKSGLRAVTHENNAQIINALRGPWTQARCPANTLTRGDCRARQWPFQMTASGFTREDGSSSGSDTWVCGGPTAGKKAWVLCSENIKTSIKEGTGSGEIATVQCDAGYKVMEWWWKRCDWDSTVGKFVWEVQVSIWRYRPIDQPLVDF